MVCPRSPQPVFLVGSFYSYIESECLSSGLISLFYSKKELTQKEKVICPRILPARMWYPSNLTVTYRIPKVCVCMGPGSTIWRLSFLKWGIDRYLSWYSVLLCTTISQALFCICYYSLQHLISTAPWGWPHMQVSDKQVVLLSNFISLPQPIFLEWMF